MSEYEKKLIEEIKGFKITDVKIIHENWVQFIVHNEKYGELNEMITKENPTEEFYQELKILAGE